MTNTAKFRALPTTKFFSNGLFDDFFNRSIADYVGADSVQHQPAVNIIETGTSFELEVAAPGFEKEQFTLLVENDQLTLSAKRESKTEESEERYTRREFRFESFKRSFKLPPVVNQAEVTAVYENGVLKVTLPKKEEAKAVVKAVSIR